MLFILVAVAGSPRAKPGVASQFSTQADSDVAEFRDVMIVDGSL